MIKKTDVPERSETAEMSPCDDSDLLLLAHGALNPRRAIAVRIHLVRCAACRVRLRQFRGLSTSLADAFRNPALGARTVGRSPVRTLVVAGVVATSLVITGGLALSLTALPAITALPAFRPAPPQAAPPPIAAPARRLRCTCRETGRAACPLHGKTHGGPSKFLDHTNIPDK